MKKLTLKQAISLFNKGRIIYLKPSKITEQVLKYSPWFSWCKVQKSDYTEEDTTLEQIVNEFIYYNCNKETGLRANYYAYL